MPGARRRCHHEPHSDRAPRPAAPSSTSVTSATRDRARARAGARLAVFKDGVRIALGSAAARAPRSCPGSSSRCSTGIALIMALVAGTVEGWAGRYRAAAEPAVALGLLRYRLDHPLRLRRTGRAGAAMPRPPRGRDQPVPGPAAHRVRLHRWRGGQRSWSYSRCAWLPQSCCCRPGDGRPGAVAVPAQSLAGRAAVPAAGAAMAAYTTTLALLTASFTTRRAYARCFSSGCSSSRRRSPRGSRRRSAARSVSGSRCST
jgi:hypothetical protein